MRWDIFFWASLGLVLMTAEAFAPGAFMLWLGLAAFGTLAVVLVASGLPVLAQVAIFACLSFLSILAYLKFFKKREKNHTTHPALNVRTKQLIGRTLVLEAPIVGGLGKVRLDDAYWDVTVINDTTKEHLHESFETGSAFEVVEASPERLKIRHLS